MDYRISIEEFESQAEIAEMARAIIQEAMEQDEESPIPTLTIRLHCHNSWGKPIEENIEMPF